MNLTLSATGSEGMKVNLHIERLILNGLPIERAQGPLVKAALEVELTRLLAEGGLGAELTSGGAVPAIKADSIELIDGSPTLMGRQIARSVYGGMSG
jgi:hypothetical protein